MATSYTPRSAAEIKAEIDGLICKTEEAAARAFEDDEFLSLYSMKRKKMHNYSYNNVVLIMLQKPNAEYVKGFGQWRKEGGFVKKGEKGIKILAPRMVPRKDENGVPIVGDDGKPVMACIGFTGTAVFDISQLTDESKQKFAVKSLDDNSSKTETIKRILSRIESDSRVSRGGVLWDGSLGFTDGERIVISNQSDDEGAVHTYLHELSHVYLGHCEKAKNGDEEIPRDIRELQAETSAFIAAKMLGLDYSRHSSNYLANWKATPKKIKDAFVAAEKTAMRIFEELK